MKKETFFGADHEGATWLETVTIHRDLSSVTRLLRRDGVGMEAGSDGVFREANFEDEKGRQRSVQNLIEIMGKTRDRITASAFADKTWPLQPDINVFPMHLAMNAALDEAVVQLKEAKNIMEQDGE